MNNQTTKIPKGWKMTTLNKMAQINPKESLKFGSVAKYIAMESLSPFTRKISGFELKNFSGGMKFRNGDTVFARITPCLENGKTSYVDILNRDEVAFGSTEYIVIREIKNISDKKFLYYLAISPKFRGVAIKAMTGTSGRQRVQNNQLFKESLISPPLSEQRAIAAVLSSFDDKIELLREKNKTLEATAQAIFKEWFVNFNFPDKNGKPYKDSGGKMIDSELGEIPEGWRVGSLIEDKISKFVKVNIDHFNGVKDYVETSNVSCSSFIGNFEKITFLDRPSRANMQPTTNSFWFARMAESRKYILFLDRDSDNIESKILSTGFAGVQCIEEYLYFYWCFILSDIFNHLKNQYAEGAVQIAISNGGIKRIRLILPPIKIAKKFTETVEFCFKKISNNNFQIQTLSSLRDTLLPKLMRGEVRIKEFNN